MINLQGKNILLAVTGSIAAYKSATLVRLLVKQGAQVKVLMTEASTSFITPLTLSTLSKNEVFTSVHDSESWNNHVDIGLWADAMIIAPATATTLGKLANGIADNMVVATYLSARCPVFFAPAMDVDMWHHPATQANVRQLQVYQNRLIPVEHGELASGLIGEGRMAEPEAIVTFVAEALSVTGDLDGKKILITAGPTYEPIDPVRFIGNRSSGKMGVALAENAAQRGATVTLILGPSKLEVTNEKIKLVKVETAQEMYEAANEYFADQDIAIMAAAVADYRPSEVSDKKIKKKTSELSLVLEKTPDIAASLGQRKKPGQLLIGFALETNDEESNARGKLERKNFDCIVLNSLQDKGAGFGHDTNKISILYRDNKIKKFELKSKALVAKDILDEIVLLLSQ